MDFNRIQAEQQVFAKLAGLTGSLEIRIRGRDEAHINPLGARRSNALDFSRLQHAQQLRLLAHGHVADLIQKNRAAIRQFEASDAVGAGIREGALHVAEEFALKHAFGQAASIHRHQLARSPQRQHMNRARDYFLAGSMLAGNQDIRVRRSKASDRFQHRDHGRRCGNELGTSLNAQQAVLSGQPFRSLQRAMKFDLGPQNGKQPLVLPRLLNKIPCARGASPRPPVPHCPMRSSR